MRDTALLLGDYLYAHGLVRIAALGEVAAVADLAELISLCAQLRAERARATAPPGRRRPRSSAAAGSSAAPRSARRDPAPLARWPSRGDDAVERALAAHADAWSKIVAPLIALLARRHREDGT